MKGFEIFFAGAGCDVIGERRGGSLFVPMDGFEIVADVLLIEGGLGAAWVVGCGGPVAGGVRGENLVGEGDRSVDEAELELGVGEDQALAGRMAACLLGVAILMAAAAFLPPAPWISNSQLSPYFLAGAHAVSFVVPHALQQQILDGAAMLKHNAPDWIKPHR